MRLAIVNKRKVCQLPYRFHWRQDPTTITISYASITVIEGCVVLACWLLLLLYSLQVYSLQPISHIIMDYYLYIALHSLRYIVFSLCVHRVECLLIPRTFLPSILRSMQSTPLRQAQQHKHTEKGLRSIYLKPHSRDLSIDHTRRPSIDLRPH